MSEWDRKPTPPERDSEGHVWRMDGVIDVYRWDAERQWYEDAKGRWFTPGDAIRDGDTYYGQIIAPSAIVARERAAWIAGRDAAADVAAKVAVAYRILTEFAREAGAARVMRDIRALTPPKDCP